MTPDEIEKLIPDEVVEAAALVLHANAEVFHDLTWDDLGDYDKNTYRDEARASIAAGIAAWPGVIHHIEGEPGRENEEIILPLRKEEV